MGAVDRHHAGAASGVNNAVARVAGLVAIAVFGIVLTRTFDARVRRDLDAMSLSQSARTTVERELPKMAGADVDSMPELSARDLVAVGGAIDRAYVAASRLILSAAALLALAAAATGAFLR